MTNAEIQSIADRVLRPHLSARGLDHIEVSLDHDDLDGPTLVVEAFIKPGFQAVGGGIVSAAHYDLSRSLLSAGEERFPYFHVRYPEEEALVDDGLESL